MKELKELKDEEYFLDIPNKEVADLLYDLGQRIKKEFNEPILGEIVITNAIQYRLGILQEQFRDFQEMMNLKFDEAMEDELLDEMQENFTVEEEKIH